MGEKEKEHVHAQDDCHLCADQQKQLKVLSTSLGVALAANLLMIPFGTGQAIAAQSESPKLTEWSTEEVKAYFDPSADWNIPFVKEEKKAGQTGESVPSSSGTNVSAGTAGFHGTGESSQPIIIRDGGFGWDDILLYHMIFNSGRPYSSSSWATSGKVFDTRTNKPYRAKSFSSDTFQNRPVVNSSVRPFTSKGTGSVTRRTPNGSGTDKAKAGSTSVNGSTSKSPTKSGSGIVSGGKSSTSSKSKTGSSSVSRGSTNHSYRVSGSGSGTSTKPKTGSSSVSRGSVNHSYRVKGSGSGTSSSSGYSSSSTRSSSGYSSSSSRSSSSFGSSKSRSSSVGGIGGRSSGYSSSSRSSSSSWSGGFGG
ncbi:hypothetical protein [Paenibacillus alvei]|uniref:hypothetical protein n=1 Tax=Paenibacillus alvei TaxID=44250 RepID=UPI0018CF6033|nr:hypothetical protein [Paenibacillus alvei]MBG9733322.1 hypothetical protein [Paenibacillus alvei]MBG9745119.1 hypothetical protein [Paenibacillus alvei]MCY9580756.1 hypothetical protein [Paenibacillus alvei]MCY9585239.1 hypothetical protein [Paenibacillus alvei]